MISTDSSTNKQRAIIVDLDETLCTSFDVPIAAGVRILRQVDESKLEVHYVTARTSVCRQATQTFIENHSLPGAHNVHYCPAEIRSYDHKRTQHKSLGRRFCVIASIGDSFEEEEAAGAAGIRFVAVDPLSPARTWLILGDLITNVTGFKL